MFPFPVKTFLPTGRSEGRIKSFQSRLKRKMETGDDLRMNELTMSARAPGGNDCLTLFFCLVLGVWGRNFVKLCFDTKLLMFGQSTHQILYYCFYF